MKIMSTVAKCHGESPLGTHFFSQNGDPMGTHLATVTEKINFGFVLCWSIMCTSSAILVILLCVCFESGPAAGDKFVLVVY